MSSLQSLHISSAIQAKFPSTKPSQSPPPSLAPQKRRYVIDLTSDDPHDSISSKKSRSGIINDSEDDESNDALRKPGKTPLPESNFEKHVLPKEYIQVVIPVKPPYQSLGRTFLSISLAVRNCLFTDAWFPSQLRLCRKSSGIFLITNYDSS